MSFLDQILISYGWEGLALAVVLLVLFGVQLYYYLFSYGSIPGYKNNKRKAVRENDPPISVIVPMFSENYTYLEEQLPLILAQEYPEFEVVIVYVGQDNDFFEELQQFKRTFPRLNVTKLHLDPRYPISRKMALNLGIKSAYHNCLVFTSVDAVVETNRWLKIMGKGFTRGDIVLGYCGMEQKAGLKNYLMRTWRMMDSVNWLAPAVAGRPYRGILHNMGFTKDLYFDVKGFNYLAMNIGEDDLFMQRIMRGDNVSVVLAPRGMIREKIWGGWSWWMNTMRYFSSARKFYAQGVKNYVSWEKGSRLLLFLAVLIALVFMPLEFKIYAAALLLIRLIVVLIEVRRIAKRIGEERIWARYPIYDLMGWVGDAVLSALLIRKDERVWR